ncbi:hypothetical protein [Jannaschia seohaensis]|uniref:Mce-associated membrane protein n=1 Tax=Jannaschia seohaensis TaxID=475081 RepID=A0A2Y9AUC9_9RHOB|nr:hypothetical protein [Jannaschia seohaensis]PWJ17542.1 hypothetical protein BCF38_106153 [Jannaschia seohaensis]SSA47686.1 hypothetical protein SAMN05421539_106153 [Jannaschia seohaensis]
MTVSDVPSPRRAPAILLSVALLAALGAGVWLLRPAPPQVLPAPGLDGPVDAAGLRGEGYGVTLAVLAAVYAAFAETEERAIYDGLAQVAAGDALEDLYLERAGALATGGLPDQVVHELSLTDGTWRMEGEVMTADVRWAVLGEVGHAEHTHIRGNAYAAELTIAPAEGAWRLTGFRLTDVDRTEAGTLTTLPGGDAGSSDG